MERGYHLTYSNPYERPFPRREVPEPVIASVRPYVVVEGDTKVAITVKGTGFTPASIVWVGETQLKTTFVSATELSATLCDPCTRVVGTIRVHVSPSLHGRKSTPARILVTHRLTKSS